MESLLDHLKRGVLPEMPPVDMEKLDPATLGAPEPWRPIVRYLRTSPFLGVPGVVGAGLGHRVVGGEETDELAAVVLVREKKEPGKVRPGETLPKEVKFDGARIPIDVQTGFDPWARFMAAPTIGAFPRATHNCSGAALTVDNGRNPCAGGSLTAHVDNRAFTCAHVALGWGFEDFVNNLPFSILWLFESPSGSRMVASGTVQVGEDMYQLFEVDTGWPILVPIPIPIPGALALLFVDGAAGRVNPIPIPPFARIPTITPPSTTPSSFAAVVPPLAPERSTRFGGRIRNARLAVPGERCHKDGQTTGLTWGRVWLPFFQLYLPIPLFGLVNGIAIFDTVLCDLTIAPGDSGAAILSDSLRYLAQVSIGLPPPGGGVGGGMQPGVVCPVNSNDLLQIALGTPYYLHELLLDVDLS